MESKKKEAPAALLKPTFITMGELQPGTRVTMYLKVDSVKITRERKRYEGSVNRSAECIVGDTHGCAILIAKDDQLQTVKAGAQIIIRNAHANVVKEHMRIEVDRWAKVEVNKTGSNSIGTVKTDNNLSDIEYELVQVAGKS